MQIVIDETTGLPEVPEGMFWRVRERETYMASSPHTRTDDGELWVELCEERRKTYYTRPAWTWKNLWIYPFLGDTVAVTKLLEPKVIAAEVMAEYKTFAHFDQDEERKKFTARRRQGQVYDRELCIRHYEPSVANVQALATLVMAAYQKMQDQKTTAEKHKALIGTYPPKTLGSIDPVRDDPATTPADKAEVGREIKQQQQKLKDLKTRYESGDYSGHPEEMLSDIDYVEYQIKKLLKLL